MLGESDAHPVDRACLPFPAHYEETSPDVNEIQLKKKQYYPVSDDLGQYLRSFGRSFDIPVVYADLHRWSELFPLYDAEGRDTFWKIVHYDSAIREELNERLVRIYSLLRTGRDTMGDHLHMARVDFCDFGNSRPFRVRIINQYNDNYDHFYVKVADSSRIFGLELEHILSPNRINYLVHGDTLIEEHIAGVPGDVFIDQYLERGSTNRVRVAKEFVKFNERSFVRLLGDMRSYNYVVDITPDFEETQYRVRAIDFDQQCYEGHKEMYLPQFFDENKPVVDMCTKLLNYETMRQYQDEERTLISRRIAVASRRLEEFWKVFQAQDIAPVEHVRQLREELNQYHGVTSFSNCRNMGQLTHENVRVTMAKLGDG